MMSNAKLTEEQKNLTYRFLFEESCEPKCIINADGRIIDANAAFYKHIGLDVSTCSCLNIYSIVPPDVAVRRKVYADEVFRTGKRISFEEERNGKHFRHSIYPVAGDNGKTRILYLFIQDISESKSAEKANNIHAAFSKEAMEAFPGAFVVLDSRGKIVSCNSWFRNFIAQSADADLSGINTFELFHPDDQTYASGKLQEILAHGGEQTADLRVKLHGGPECRWFRISTKRLIVDNDIFLVSSGFDIEKYKKTEKQLILSNEQLRFILAESKTGSWDWDTTTNEIKWSNEIWELYGLEKGSCMPSFASWRKTVIEDEREATEHEVLAASKQGIPFRVEWQSLHPDGSLHWVMARGIPFRASDGTVSRYVGISIDITDLKDTEFKLKKSEERFRKLFEEHTSAILIIDAATKKIIGVNVAATVYYGWSSEVMYSMNIDEIATGATHKLSDLFPTVRDSEKTRFFSVHRKADNTLREVELLCSCSNLSEKSVYFCIVNDVTERNTAQRELLKSKAILDTALESMSDAVFISDIDGRLFEFNTAFAKFHRFRSKEECPEKCEDYKKLLELFMLDGTPIPHEQWPVPRALRGESAVSVQHIIRRKDSGMQWIGSYSFAPVHDSEGKITGSVVNARDITHLKEAEKALRESEERFRNFFEQHSAVMMILDPESGSVVDINNAAVEYYGWSKETLLRMNIMDITIRKPEKTRKLLDEWKTAEKLTITATHRKADGTICDIDIYGKKIYVHNRPLAYLIIHDITEQKRFQQALMESSERLHFILNTTNAGIWISNTVTLQNYWSDELWRLYGLEPNSFPLTYENIVSSVLPEDREPFEHSITSAIASSVAFNSRWRIQDVNGNIRWLMGKGSPVTDDEGKVIKYVGITLDITEQKQIEDQKSDLETRIRKSERMETLGTLAGGIAHDFNNILTPILSYAEIGMLELPEHDPRYNYFNQITIAAERAKNLVYQILAFSKARETESSCVSVQAVIDEALKLLRPSIPATIRIEKSIDPACRDIFADPSKIYQVILNLCTNAYQAMAASGGTLRIKLDEIMPDSSLIDTLPELHDQPYVRLTIADTGHGMDNKTLDRIFEPFFTTKPVNKGTGLGLSVVHGIITGYNGVIDVETQPEKGSAFTIYLPVSDTNPIESEQNPLTQGKPSSILLVDDEQAILDVMTMILSYAGHRVETVHSARQASGLVKLEPKRFDVVVTDLTMPEMTGIQLAAALDAYSPGLPVILMTGYERDPESSKALIRSNIVRVLKKPVRVDALITAINDALGCNRPS